MTSEFQQALNQALRDQQDAAKEKSWQEQRYARYGLETTSLHGELARSVADFWSLVPRSAYITGYLFANPWISQRIVNSGTSTSNINRDQKLEPSLTMCIEAAGRVRRPHSTDEYRATVQAQLVTTSARKREKHNRLVAKLDREFEDDVYRAWRTFGEPLDLVSLEFHEYDSDYSLLRRLYISGSKNLIATDGRVDTNYIMSAMVNWATNNR